MPFLGLSSFVTRFFVSQLAMVLLQENNGCAKGFSRLMLMALHCFFKGGPGGHLLYSSSRRFVRDIPFLVSKICLAILF